MNKREKERKMKDDTATEGQSVGSAELHRSLGRKKKLILHRFQDICTDTYQRKTVVSPQKCMNFILKI